MTNRDKETICFLQQDAKSVVQVLCSPLYLMYKFLITLVSFVIIFHQLSLTREGKSTISKSYNPLVNHISHIFYPLFFIFGFGISKQDSCIFAMKVCHISKKNFCIDGRRLGYWGCGQWGWCCWGC